MDIRHLGLFLRVADRKSISKAADESFITRQALTEDMNKLERELGIKLFVRSNQGVTLTEEGAYFQKNLSKMATKWRSTLEHMRRMGQQLTEFNLGLPMYFFLDSFVHELAHTVGTMSSAHVNVYDWPSQKCLELLSEGKLHVAISYETPEDPEIFCISQGNPDGLGHGGMDTFRAVMMSENNPLARKGQLSLEDLRGHTLLVIEGERFHQEFFDFCSGYDIDIKIVPRNHSLSAMMIRDDEGLEFLPLKSAKVFLAEHDGIIAREVEGFPVAFCANVFVRNDAPQIVVDVAEAISALL